MSPRRWLYRFWRECMVAQQVLRTICPRTAKTQKHPPPQIVCKMAYVLHQKRVLCLLRGLARLRKIVNDALRDRHPRFNQAQPYISPADKCLHLQFFYSEPVSGYPVARTNVRGPENRSRPQLFFLTSFCFSSASSSTGKAPQGFIPFFRTVCDPFLCNERIEP